MRALVATPFIPIARNVSSHRAAQAVIYADQLKRSGVDVTCNMSLDLYHADFNEFDVLYHTAGNDWTGNLNLFGGLKTFPHTNNFVNFSKFRGEVRSLAIDFPNYYDQLKKKVDQANEKGKEIDPRWNEVDWDNVLCMERESVTVDPNVPFRKYGQLAVGDSHAICMYRPNWMLNSIPFKTLHGALDIGLENLLLGLNDSLYEIEFYFGNIDVRHHLLRQTNPAQATIDLVKEYFKQAHEVAWKTASRVRIYEPLPIENESRSIPRTGWYKNTPFYGTWNSRNALRDVFIDEAKKLSSKNVEFFEWCSRLKNDKGELDFAYMEKPHSIHLSREYYPHWQGEEWNKSSRPGSMDEKATLEAYFG